MHTPAVKNRIKPSHFYLALCLWILFSSALHAATASSQNAQPKLQDLRAFTEVYAKIRDEFYAPLDANKLFENAIDGMLTEADPYSDYLTKAEYAHLADISEGRYAGIGVEISSADQRLEITRVMPDSPAANARIDAGDFILAVNNIPVRGRQLSESLEAMRGEAGSKVVIKIMHHTIDGSNKIRNIKMERAIIHYNEVSSRRLVNNYLLLKIKSFQRNTGIQTRTEIEQQLVQKNIPGLVLDLRGNPGGILTSGAAVADLFLTDGPIVLTKTRGGSITMQLSADPVQVLDGVPIVIMVDNDTASAAEIVTGALQDSGRAKVVGETTFGKGSVQTIFPLSNGGALKLTTAHYFTPSGNIIHGHGIKPDIAVDLDDESKDKDPILTASIEYLKRLQ